MKADKPSILKSYLYILSILIKKHSLYSVLLIIVATFMGLITPAYIWMTGWLVERIELILIDSGQNVKLLIAPISGFLGIILLQYILDFLSETIKSLLNIRVSIDLQHQFMDKAKGINLAYFEQEESFNKIHRANKVFGSRIVNTFQEAVRIFALIVSITGYITILLSVHFILFLVIAIVIVPSLYFKIKRARLNYEVAYHDLTPVEREASYYERLITNVTVFKERKTYNLFNIMLDRWREAHSTAKSLILKNASKEIQTHSFVELINIVNYGITLVILCFFVLTQKIQIASFVMLTQTLSRIQNDIEEVTGLIRSLYNQGLYFNDLIEFLEMPLEYPSLEEHRDQVTTVPFPRNNISITFKDVSFRYPNSGRWAIQDISFSVKHGETIAIIGENGSGKTTLMKLLSAFYRPTQGAIFVGNVNYADMKETEIRNHLSAIFQNHINYKLTLKEAISFGNIAQVNNVSAIKEVVSKAKIDQLVKMMPDEFETFLSREFDGVNLSGGQWQKVAFARCLMRDAPILILDEPTSALDPIAEIDLLREFKQLAHNKTTFFVTHRVGSARIADKILVIDQGRLVEVGSHDELIKMNGKYREIYNAQSQWY